MDESKLKGKAKRKYRDFCYQLSELIEQNGLPAGDCKCYYYFKDRYKRLFRVSPSDINVWYDTYRNTPVCSFKNVDLTDGHNQGGTFRDVYSLDELSVITEAEFLEAWNAVERTNKNLWTSMSIGEAYHREDVDLYIVRDKYSTKKVLGCGLIENHYYLLVDYLPNFILDVGYAQRKTLPDFSLKGLVPGTGIMFESEDGRPIYEAYKKVLAGK